MNKASIHLLNNNVFAYYRQVVAGKELHVVRTRCAVRMYDPDVDGSAAMSHGVPNEVAAGVVVALMSKDHAMELVTDRRIPSGLPPETVAALKPLTRLL